MDDYIHTLSNKPDYLNKEISEIKLRRQAFEQEVDQLKIESKEAEKISTSTAGAGVMAGVGVAAFGPTAAMAVPVVLEELMIRILWMIRQRFVRKKSWKESYPSSAHADLRIMLIVENAILCVIDGADAVRLCQTDRRIP